MPGPMKASPAGRPIDLPVKRQCTGWVVKAGRRCRRSAIKGGTVCMSHGGAAPQVRAAARRRLELALVDAAMAGLWRRVSSRIRREYGETVGMLGLDPPAAAVLAERAHGPGMADLLAGEVPTGEPGDDLEPIAAYDAAAATAELDRFEAEWRAGKVRPWRGEAPE